MKLINGLFYTGCAVLGVATIYNLATNKNRHKLKYTVKEKQNTKQSKEETKEDKINQIDATQLCNIYIEIKFSLISVYDTIWKELRKSNQEISCVPLLKMVDAEQEKVLKRLGISEGILNQLTLKFAADKDVINHSNDLKLYKEEIKKKQIPSLLRKCFEQEEFIQLYSLFIYSEWHFYYLYIEELMNKKKHQDGKTSRVKPEEMGLMLYRMQQLKLAEKVVKKLSINVQSTKAMSIEQMVQMTFFYYCSIDPHNYLIQLDSANKGMLALIQLGQKIAELEVSPLELPEEQIKSNFNTLLKKVKEFRQTVNDCLQKVKEYHK